MDGRGEVRRTGLGLRTKQWPGAMSRGDICQAMLIYNMFRQFEEPGWAEEGLRGHAEVFGSISRSERGAWKVSEQEFKLVESGRKGWRTTAIRL